MAQELTKQQRRQAARELIDPFLDEWRGRSPNVHAAFRDWAVEQLLWERGLSPEEIRDVTRIDGSKDKGIDGWYLDIEGDEPVLVLVQAKDTAAEISDITKLRHGFEHLLSPKGRHSGNDEAKSRAAELERLRPEGLRVEFRVVTSDIAPPSFEGDLHTFAENHPTVAIFGQDCPCDYDIHDVERLASELRVIDGKPIPAAFTIPRTDYFQHRTGSFTTFTATVPADQIVQLFEEHRTNLFRYNPRYYLSAKTSPNREMRKTLESPDGEDFFVYNNGITAISSKLPDPKNMDGSEGEVVLRANNFQIVNGCQTTVTLHSVAKGVSLRNVRVLVRIIEAENFDATAKEIAKTSNNQNRMRESDLKSTEQIQLRLHAEFLLESPPWFYEYKRGVWATDYKTRDRREPYLDEDGTVRKVTKEDAAQASLAFLGKPAEAAESSGAIFSVPDRYSAVFPAEVRAIQMILGYRLYRVASAFTSDLKTKHAWADYLRYPLVAMISRLAHEIAGSDRDDEGYLEYFSVEDSRQLLATIGDWVPELITPAFEALAGEVDRRLKAEEIGARSLVRQREWWEPAYAAFKLRLLDQIRYERRLAAEARRKGLDATFGFSATFPLTLVLED